MTVALVVAPVRRSWGGGDDNSGVKVGFGAASGMADDISERLQRVEWPLSVLAGHRRCR